MTGSEQGSRSDLSRLDALKATGDLPSPKGVALEIMRATRGDDVSTAELARIIKADPAFSGRMIKAANGLLGYGRRPVASVQDALMVMGLPAVRTLALGFSLLGHYRAGPCLGFDYDAYWSSSLLRAVALQAFSKHVRCAPPDEAFCLGLLSRVGELALATVYPQQYSDVLAASAGDLAKLGSLEQQAFGLDRHALTGLMLTDWGVPGVFADAVLHHDPVDASAMPADARTARLSAVLALAAQLSRVCEVDAEAAPAALQVFDDMGGRLDYSTALLHETCERVIRDWAEWSVLLRVPNREVFSFAGHTATAPVMANQPAPTMAAERASVAVPPVPARAGYLRVLVADADAASRSVIRSVLDEAGHEVQEVDSVELAAEAALVMQPQLMIIDWSMPDGCGLSLVQRLRQTRVGRSIYVLVLTSHENEQRLVEAFESGVDDFITKPINPRVLLARMRAGQRVVRLHQEVEQDREEIRQFAAELAVSNRKLQEGTLTDSLTGFPNRRYFLERLEQEWAQAVRMNRPLACLVIDVDGFRQLNQTYGLDVGDAALMQVSKGIKESLRRNDVVARAGGDEFFVLCPETDSEAARLVAERIRALVSTVLVRAGRLQLRVSISIGIALRGADVANAEDLLKRAESALAGTNGVQNFSACVAQSGAGAGADSLLTH
ncbi:diguanylate cyclase [Niveibacterium sp. 24ML]|uniref:diguanylate cyclase domain-containing protein n=1 Tax=Niveibacterium sp. 24ML TaxID=2985512 RepID=UPI00227212A7|nr:diguanylate cyclase [Niveibacterium sp. 24ML]MCX9158325.1 diguanylate cyclase [Niveibacterium sp. 24ML]